MYEKLEWQIIRYILALVLYIFYINILLILSKSNTALLEKTFFEHFILMQYTQQFYGCVCTLSIYMPERNQT